MFLQTFRESSRSFVVHVSQRSAGDRVRNLSAWMEFFFSLSLCLSHIYCAIREIWTLKRRVRRKAQECRLTFLCANVSAAFLFLCILPCVPAGDTDIRQPRFRHAHFFGRIFLGVCVCVCAINIIFPPNPRPVGRWFHRVQCVGRWSYPVKMPTGRTAYVSNTYTKYRFYNTTK